jgi:hypothetical protein
MKHFFISTLIFCAVGLAGTWALLNWHRSTYPVSIVEDAYYCYRKKDAQCLNHLVDSDAVVSNFLAESKANTFRAVQNDGEPNPFKQWGTKLGIGMLYTIKPLLITTLNNTLANTIQNSELQKAVNDVAPWQAKLFTFYPHTKNFDVQTTELEAGIFELTIQREANTPPLVFKVERQEKQWKIINIPIHELQADS